MTTFAIPDLKKRFEFLVSVCSRMMNRHSAKALTGLGINGRHYALMAMTGNDPINQTTLAERMHINRNVMVKMLDELQDKELLRREFNPDNRREYFINLTEKGKQLLGSADEVMKDVERDFMTPLSEREQQIICDLLRKVVKPYVGW